MIFIPCIFSHSLFLKPTKCTTKNTTKQITKHTSYQVPTPTCFGSKVPPSGSSSTTKFCRSNTQFRCYLPSLPTQKLKALKCSNPRLNINRLCPHCCSCSYFWAVPTNICINIWSKGILSSCSIRCIPCQGTCTVFCDLLYCILISAFCWF